MNGIDPVAIATGNDWRAIEAGAHAYAARSGRYSSLTDWWADEQGNLCGRIEMPIKVGIVGAPLESNPTVALNLRLLDVESATELAQVMAAVGPRAELRRDPRARDRRHPERPHDAARAQRRDRGRHAEGDLRRRARSADPERRHQGLEGAGDRHRGAGRAPSREARRARAKRSQEAEDGRRLRQGDPARRARGRLRPPRDRGADPAHHQGARRGLRRGHSSSDPALGRGVSAREQPERAALVRAAGRRRARPARLEPAVRCASRFSPTCRAAWASAARPPWPLRSCARSTSISSLGSDRRAGQPARVRVREGGPRQPERARQYARVLRQGRSCSGPASRRWSSR